MTGIRTGETIGSKKGMDYECRGKPVCCGAEGGRDTGLIGMSSVLLGLAGEQGG